MIEPRSSVLYKTWMDVHRSPAAEKSRVSYISYISSRQEFVLRVVADDGFLISSEELLAERTSVSLPVLENIKRLWIGSYTCTWDGLHTLL